MNKNIRKAAAGEMLRVACFVIYYISLILLGIIIIAGTAFLTFFLVAHLVDRFQDGDVLVLRKILGALIIISCIWTFAGMFGLYLIRPLFKSTRDVDSTRVEVTENECPELFKAIREIVDKVGCGMPARVFLAPNADASVSYDTSFWRIFLPVKKNLNIGLGLFEGMNIEEIKAIIAHELGHFPQGHRLMSTVIISNKVLYNLVNENESWYNWVDSLCVNESWFYRFVGKCARGMTKGINKCTRRVYGFVTKGYLKLERLNEFEADNISCKIVDKRDFISMLCKLEVRANRYGEYCRFLRMLASDGLFVNRYFECMNIFNSLLPEFPDKEIKSFTYSDTLTRPLCMLEGEIRDAVSGEWDSHPSIEERLENAQNNGMESEKRPEPQDSWLLIPEETVVKVSDKIISLNMESCGDLELMNTEDFSAWADDRISEHIMDNRLRPYFEGRIFMFQLDDSHEAPEECPFNETNARIFAGFRKALKEGTLSENDINALDLLIQEKSLDIYSYVMKRVDDDEKANFRIMYKNTFYLQDLLYGSVGNLNIHRDMLTEEITAKQYMSKKRYQMLCKSVAEFEERLKTVLSEINIDWFCNYINEESAEQFRNYSKSVHNKPGEFEIETIKEMFSLSDSLYILVENLYKIYVKDLTTLIKETLDRKSVSL